MSNKELQEKIKLIRECQQALYELHEEFGTRLAKSCAGYMDYILESLEKPPEDTVRKEFAVGQKVTLMDTVQEPGFLCAPTYTHKKGAVGWIVNDGGMLCNGRSLRLDSERVKVKGIDPEGIALFLWYCIGGKDETEWLKVHREYFQERIEAAICNLNFPVAYESDQPREITFDDLSKNQFWQDRQDLFKLEED